MTHERTIADDIAWLEREAEEAWEVGNHGRCAAYLSILDRLRAYEALTDLLENER